MSRLMGGDFTASVLKNRVIDKFMAVGKLQYAALAAGQDPATIDVNVDRKNFKSNRRPVSLLQTHGCIFGEHDLALTKA